jgi:hypothetical protein
MHRASAGDAYANGNFQPKSTRHQHDCSDRSNVEHESMDGAQQNLGGTFAPKNFTVQRQQQLLCSTGHLKKQAVALCEEKLRVEKQFPHLGVHT